MYRQNGIIQGISILCGFKYQVKGNRQNTACEHMPLQMSIWLLMNLLLVSSLKAIAALPSHTETSVHEVLHMRCKVKYIFFFFFAGYLLLNHYGCFSGLMVLRTSEKAFPLPHFFPLFLLPSNPTRSLVPLVRGFMVKQSQAGICPVRLSSTCIWMRIMNGL